VTVEVDVQLHMVHGLTGSRLWRLFFRGLPWDDLIGRPITFVSTNWASQSPCLVGCKDVCTFPEVNLVCGALLAIPDQFGGANRHLAAADRDSGRVSQLALFYPFGDGIGDDFG
jgi:hypothetical protein